MNNSLDVRIRESRKKLNNPYAHLGGDGEYDAVLPDQSPTAVHAARKALENPYAYLDEQGQYSEFIKHQQGLSSGMMALDTLNLLDNKRKGNRFSKKQIESIVRRLQIAIWKNRKAIWPEVEVVSPISALDPVAALQFLEYDVDVEETLGQYSTEGEIFEVAGMVNAAEKHVRLSRRFSPEIQNFTAAHELAHVVMHQATGLHRDRVLDGSAGNSARDEREVEADIFAAYFLMPEKQVKIEFAKVFQTDSFSITDETAFALIADSTDALNKKCRTTRDLAKLLAITETYAGRRFKSLSRLFRVSTEAMAIRLEELNLIGRK